MTVDQFTSQCEDIGMPIKGVRLPVIDVDSKYKKELKLDLGCTNFEFLRALCKRGFNDLKLDKGSKAYDEYGARIKYELNIIEELGFVDYILLVWDVVNYCKENDIPIGAGRGSAAGSLLLHLIGITRVDPIKYGLYFERFLSKSRAKKTIIDGVTYFDGSLVPDIDIDFDFYQRHKVIEYLNNKYEGKICKILTLNSLSSKLLIKEVGKCLGMKTEEEMTGVTNLIPKLHGQVKDIDEAYDEVPDFKNWCDNNPIVYENAKKIKDLVKNTGVHPSGILISYDKLEDCCPTQLTSDKEEVSGYDMNWVAAFAIKLDALGLRNVSVIADCCKHIGIKPDDIDIHDPIIYQSLYDLKFPHGIFQIETESGFRICQKVKPKNIKELSAIMAINRPGAMQFVDKYANYTNTGTYESLHPFFDDVLMETGSTCLYQEQMLRMVNKLGFSLDEAETLRRIVGKKKVLEMPAWKEKIFAKVAEQKLPVEVGKLLWKILDDSKDYSFNACLSPDTVIETPNGDKMMFEVQTGDKIKAFDVTNQKDHFVEVKNKFNNIKELFEVEMEDGRKIKCSMEHKFLCEDKNMRSLQEILLHKHKIICNE